MLIPVVAAVISKDDSLLLLGREKARTRQSYLEFPGGKVENYETLERALAREILEEINCKIINSTLIHAQINSYPGEGASYLVLYYKVDIEGIPISVEGNSINWINIQEIIGPHEIPMLPGTIEATQVLM